MIKRIIFDIDNTLLDTYKDCIETYQKYAKKIKLNISAEDIYNIFDEYEKNNGNYNKNDLAVFLGKKLNIKYTESDLNDLLDLYSKHSTLLNNKTEVIFAYLSEKYEIVALSNWYKEIQYKRLKKSNISKYFKEIYGLEDGIKPNELVFKKSCGKYKYNECLIIGDSINSDILVPKKLGMKTIYFNKNLKENNKEEINNLLELKNIL